MAKPVQSNKKTVNGKAVEVRCGTHGPIKAETHSLPFYDVDKKRRSVKG